MICFIITYGFDVHSNSAKCMDVHSTRSSKSNTIASSLQVQSVHFVCSTNGEYVFWGRGSKDLKDVCFALSIPTLNLPQV